MFKLIQTSRIFGDETSFYDVVLDKEYTVKEFIDAVLSERSDEWGEISISKERCLNASPSIEYRYGNIVSDPTVMDIVLDRKITSVKAHGGWSLMDYWLGLEE